MYDVPLVIMASFIDSKVSSMEMCTHPNLPINIPNPTPI